MNGGAEGNLPSPGTNLPPGPIIIGADGGAPHGTFRASLEAPNSLVSCGASNSDGNAPIPKLPPAGLGCELVRLDGFTR